MDREETNEEDELQETRRLATSKSDTAMNILSNIPIVGWILGFIIGYIANKINEVKRRRRSYKLALYFQAQMILGLTGFLLFLIIALIPMSWLTDTSRVTAECQLPDSVTLVNGTVVNMYDSTGIMINLDASDLYQDTYRQAIPCTNEDVHYVDAACNLTQMYAIVDPPPQFTHCLGNFC